MEDEEDEEDEAEEHDTCAGEGEGQAGVAEGGGCYPNIIPDRVFTIFRATQSPGLTVLPPVTH